MHLGWGFSPDGDGDGGGGGAAAQSAGEDPDATSSAPMDAEDDAGGAAVDAHAAHHDLGDAQQDDAQQNPQHQLPQHQEDEHQEVEDDDEDEHFERPTAARAARKLEFCSLVLTKMVSLIN